MRRSARILLVAAAAVVAAPGCAYFNTLYNAKAKYREAQDILKKADPEREKISAQEEKLYAEAIERAAKVVKYYPDSRWVDDALLLMGKAAFEKGDHSTALRKFDEILTFFPDTNLRAETLLMKGRTAIATKDYAEAVEALTQAAAIDKKEFRDDVSYFLGVVQQEQGNQEEALSAFADILARYRGSEWFAEAGLRAGKIAEEQGDLAEAVAFFERVRDKGRTPQERHLAGMRKGKALLAMNEPDRARTTFHDVARRSTNEEDEGKALLEKGNVYRSVGDIERATEIYRDIIERMPLREPAAEAQLAIAGIFDDAGDLERAREEYDKVREQGSGHPAWQKASSRMTEIQAVLDLRAAIESDDDEDRARKRFLLAEQLLEKIGDVDAALAEYSSLAADAFGTEWGARALFAEAWVLEHRLARPDSAESLLYRLANYYTGTDVNAYARRKFGYPVWKVEVVDAPPVQFIRTDDSEKPTDIVLSRATPRDVPLPEGVSQVEVWTRLRIADDGSVADATVVKSGGAEFDEAALEAARASVFLGPNAGGPEFAVERWLFPPAAPEAEAAAESKDAADDASRAPEPPRPPEGDERLRSARFGVPGADSLAVPEGFSGAPLDTTFRTSPPPGPGSNEGPPLPRLRDRAPRGRDD